MSMFYKFIKSSKQLIIILSGKRVKYLKIEIYLTATTIAFLAITTITITIFSQMSSFTTIIA
ncbi:hypothetical protein RhiirA1_203617 [Rhizophagus irregularis]|uniref:Uncharacterized protein n=1 Tax=Rhizophagus irregularis TaxID=588596 RepID=A0A2N0RPV6_9GLOM|nr:hypothetical protein RhiirA1_203617 [Rhizophagus irregularis]